MTNSSARNSGVTTLHFDALKRWRQTVAAIAAGQLPTLEELRSGSGFAAGDMKGDIRIWCRDLLLENAVEDVADRIQHLHDACSVAALDDLRTAFEHEGDEYTGRLDFYLAAKGEENARHRVVCDILGSHSRNYRRIVFGLAVAMNWGAILDPQKTSRPAETVIKSTASDLEMVLEAAIMLDRNESVQSPEDLLQVALDNAIEDRAEIDPSIPVPKGLLVVPAGAALSNLKGYKRDVMAGYGGIIGAVLPYVYAPDPVDAVERFGARLPHAVQAFIRILGHHQAGDPLNLGQWLLVGPPGTGKTTFIRTVGEILGMPVTIHGLAGASDSSIMGTSAQWATARPTPVLQFINETKIANVLIGWDEIEKTGTSRHNGSALEALLPILERHTAKRHRDLALEVEVDLSMVSHIATCNTLEGIARPVLDRFRIIQMPEPGWQHIGVLSRSILDKLAGERGLDPRWFPNLQGDEIEALKTVWSGGSIRRLEHALKILVDGRDRLLGQA